ncbi:MAG: metallophosphoesterase [Thermoplasmata archaeon]
MLIGLISDTHDSLPAVEAAALVMRKRGVGLVLHAGDIVAPFVAPALAKAGVRVVAVYGNNDGERAGLKKRFKEIGELAGDLAEVDPEGRRVAVYHGTERALADALTGCGRYDLVVLGHTHEPRIERRGRTLVVNPGEACGYLTGKRTLALVDTGSMEAELVDF